jgi:hypothetical protein
MPSPLGHALGGLTAGWIVAWRGPRRDPMSFLREALVFAIAGMAADVDLLAGTHRGPTHGWGSAVLVGAGAFLLTRRALFAAATAAAYASHTLLDWLGTDSTSPMGVMALWPLTREYYESGAHLFQAISRRYWLPGFWTSNVKAIAREVIVLGPLAIVVGYLRHARNHRPPLV